MLHVNFNKPAILIPRHRKSPVDSYLFNRIYSKKFYIPTLVGKSTNPLVQKIRNFVHQETGNDPFDQSEDREDKLVISRQLFLYFVRKYVKNSAGKKITQKDAGALVGKDHATVWYAEQCVEKFFDREREYRASYNRIDSAINNTFG